MHNIYASNDQFEKPFIDTGYMEVDKALQKSKKHFKRNIALPTQFPPVTFTHHLGRFSDLEGNANDDFEAIYLNEDSGIHYSIRVKPVKYKLIISEEKIDHTINLSDGSEAVYSTWLQAVNILAFENNKMQYILSIDKRMSKTVTKEVLVEIANSVK